LRQLGIFLSLRYFCNSCTCFNIPHQHARTQHVCSSHVHAHTKSHPPHVTHLPSTGVITGKLRPFCSPPVLTLVSLSLFNTILVTLYVITTRIILQKHPRKSIHIWYIRLIVIFFYFHVCDFFNPLLPQGMDIETLRRVDVTV